MLAEPGRWRLSRKAGDSIDIELRLKDSAEPPVAVDLTGYTFRCQLRPRLDVLPSDEADLLDFEIDDSDAATGVILLHLDEGLSDTFRSTILYADLEAEIGDTRDTLLEITIDLLKQATKQVSS